MYFKLLLSSAFALTAFTAQASGGDALKGTDLTTDPLPSVSVEMAQAGGTRFYYYPTFDYNASTRQLSTEPNLYYTPAQPRFPVAQPVNPPRRASLGPVGNLYGSVRVLMNDVHELHYDALTTAPFSATTSFDDGFGVTGAVGSYLGSWNSGSIATSLRFQPRAELEIGLRAFDVDRSGFVGNTTGDGDVMILSGMANIYNDVNIGSLTAYLGAGAGLVQVEMDNITSTSANDPTRVDGDAGTYAVQGIAGVGFNVTPASMITLEARRFHITELDYDSDDGSRKQTNLRMDEVSLGFLTRF